MEDQKPSRALEIIALVIAIGALVVSIKVGRLTATSPASTLETCYDWETHVSTGTLDHATWFAGGTMFYYYREGDNELHWVDVPWKEPLEGLNEGDIITVTKEYKEACRCIGGKIVSRSNVAEEVRVTHFEVQHRTLRNPNTT